MAGSEFVVEEIDRGSDDGREGSDIESVQDVGNDMIREWLNFRCVFSRLFISNTIN